MLRTIAVAALVRGIRQGHGYHHEIKWRNVKREALPFYDDLIEAFFRIVAKVSLLHC